MQRFEIRVEDTEMGRISVLGTRSEKSSGESASTPRIEEKEHGESTKAGGEDV